jgi:hypothetical protein
LLPKYLEKKLRYRALVGPSYFPSGENRHYHVSMCIIDGSQRHKGLRTRMSYILPWHLGHAVSLSTEIENTSEVYKFYVVHTPFYFHTINLKQLLPFFNNSVLQGVRCILALKSERHKDSGNDKGGLSLYLYPQHQNYFCRFSLYSQYF